MLGFSCCRFIAPSWGWTLLGSSGQGWWCAHSQDAAAFLASITLVSFIAGWMLIICLSAKKKYSSFLLTGAEQGGMGVAAVAPGLVLLHHLVLPWGERIHPSPLASAAGDGSCGTKVPMHWPLDRVGLKAVLGACLNIFPFFFICLRGFTVLVTPLRDLSSSLFGCEYLTNFNVKGIH